MTEKTKSNLIRIGHLVALFAMVLQLVYPLLDERLIEPAFASSATYDFTDDTAFSTGSSAMVNDAAGVAQFQLNWTISHNNLGTATRDTSDILTLQNANGIEPLTYLFLRVGGKLFRSTQSGNTWAQELQTTDSVNDVSGTIVTAPGPDPLFVVAVGSDGGVGTIAYSDDGGANWQTPSSMPDFAADGITSVDYVAFEPQTDNVIAVLNDGQTLSSTDGGDNWTYDSDTGLGSSVTELSWSLDGSKLLVGTSSGEVWKSTDDGNTWDKVDGIGGSGLPAITEIAFEPDAQYVFVAGTDILYRGTLASDLDTAGAWVNQAANIPLGGWIDLDFSNLGTLMVSVPETSSGAKDGVIISSFDNGSNWAIVDTALPGSRVGLGISRRDELTNNSAEWLVLDGSGNVDAYAGVGYGDNAWLISTDGISAAQLNSLSASFHDATESSVVKIAFGFSNDPAGTWYYYTGGAWNSGVGTNKSFATTASALTGPVLQSFSTQVPVTGPLYVRIYLYDDGTVTNNLIVLDSLIVNYSDAAGGGGPDAATNDKTPPTSDVIDLPDTQATVPFTVSEWLVDLGSGVDYAKLYYTKSHPAENASDLIQFGAAMHGCPTECFSWEFTAPQGDGTYFFYSSAVDKAGNDNFAGKFLGLPVGQVPEVEAQTVVDTEAPYVVYSYPDQDATLVPRDGNLYLHFSERMLGSTLDYNLYYISGGKKIDAKSSITSLTWIPSTYCDDTGHCMYPVTDINLSVNYAGLKAGTEYFFTIRHITDRAGHDIQKNAVEPPASQPVWMLAFNTAPVLDPDLTQSKLEITNLPNTGKYKPGDKVSFKATLKNASDSVAQLVSADIPVADGLAYCSTQGCSGATASSGTLVVQNDNGKVTLHWTGQVAKGTDVTISFDARAVDPALELAITQSLLIDDGVHEDTYIKTVVVELEEMADFSASVKAGTCFWMGMEQPCTNAVVGTLVHYTVTVTNTGSTASHRTVLDNLNAAYLDLVTDPAGQGWESLEYDADTNTILAEGMWKPGQSLSFTFSGRITQEADGLTIANVADIEGWDDDPSFSIFVPGTSEPDQFPPMIVAQSPAADEAGVSPETSIEIEFSKSIDTQTFDFTLSLGGEQVNTSGWTSAWEEANGMADSKVVLTMPSGTKLDQASEYEVHVANTTADTDGNSLAAGGLPNPWRFITVDPALAFTSPTDPVIKVQRDKVSGEVVISVIDKNTKQAYSADEETKIGILAETASGSKVGNKRKISTTAAFSTSSTGSFMPSIEGNIFHLSVAKGQSSVKFYFKDSVSELLTLVAFPDPWNGWSAATKTALVTDENLEDLVNRLTIDIASETVVAGQFSSAITVTATAADGSSLRLPKTLYFYTESLSGSFYDKSFKELPDYITIQALNPQSNLQYAGGIGGNSATFYYKDSLPTNALVTISDNAPLAPDTGLQNANAFIKVVSPVEPKEIEKELEPVVDDTGRVLESVVIDPTEVVLLPGGLKSFAAKAMDTDGKEIKNAIFKWYVIAGGGTIEKDGLDDDSAKTTFTAGDELGSFYDTVLVATLYNGKFGYATASVRVADIVDMGPGYLPTTGVSGIQLIFMVITLAAAVALAWVEHCEKTLASAEADGGGK